MEYKNTDKTLSVLLALPLDVTILVPTQELLMVLSPLLPHKNISVNDNVTETNLTIHSSSEYWDWSKLDIPPLPSKVVALVSL